MSSVIRDYLTTHPEAGPKEVITALAEQNVEVSATLVSNVKRRMQEKAMGIKSIPGRKPGRPRQIHNGNLTFAQLSEAKRFADQMGSLEAAQRALESLLTLR
jgi:hypothetical protein